MSEIANSIRNEVLEFEIHGLWRIQKKNNWIKVWKRWDDLSQQRDKERKFTKRPINQERWQQKLQISGWIWSGNLRS